MASTAALFHPLKTSVLFAIFNLFQNTTFYLASKNNSYWEKDEHDEALYICQAHILCFTAHNIYFENRFTSKTQGVNYEEAVYTEHFNDYLDTYHNVRYHHIQTTLLLLPSSQSRSSTSSTENHTLDWSNLLFHAISDTASWGTHISFPTYAVAFVKDPTVTGLIEDYPGNAMLPEILGFSKFIAFFSSNEKVISMMACYSCEKNMNWQLEHDPEIPSDWQRTFRTFTLQKTKNNGVLQTLADFNKIWHQLNEVRWNNFGSTRIPSFTKNVWNMDKVLEMFDNYVKNDFQLKNFDDKKAACQSGLYERPPKRVTEKHFDWPNPCIVETLCLKKNLTYCYIYEVLFIARLNAYFGMESEQWNYKYFRYNIPSVGVYQRGLKFFTILGDKESAKRVPMDFNRLKEPLPNDVWIPLVASFLWLLFALSHSNLVIADFEIWLFWMLGVALEQRDDMRIQRNKRNSHLIITWMLSMFFMRNLYCFSMYSLLTAPAVPIDLPETKYDLEGVLANVSASVRTYRSELSTQSFSQFNYDTANEFQGTENKKFLRFYNLFVKYVVEMDHPDGLNLHDVIKAISQSVPSECRKVLDKKTSFACNTFSRFSYAYWSDEQPNLAFLLGMSSTKSMHFPTDNSKFFTESLGYIFSGKRIYTEYLITMLTSYIESGIMHYLKEWNNVRQAIQRVKYSEDWWKDNLYSHVKNPLSFALNFYQNNRKMKFFQGYKSLSDMTWADCEDGSDSYESMKLEGVGMIFIFYFGLCLISCLVIWIELIYSTSCI